MSDQLSRDIAGWKGLLEIGQRKDKLEPALEQLIVRTIGHLEQFQGAMNTANRILDHQLEMMKGRHSE